MRYSRTFLFYAAVSVVVLFTLSCGLWAEEKYTDFRGNSAYSSGDVEKALFPDSDSQQGSTIGVRGVKPATPKSLPPSETTPSPTKAAIALNVVFAPNSDRILPQYYDDLDKLGEALARRREAYLQIEGHTDSRGAASLNQILSEKRAESVKQYLVRKHSLASDHITVKGFGPSMPRASNDTAEGRSSNRRVEVVNLQSK